MCGGIKVMTDKATGFSVVGGSIYGACLGFVRAITSVWALCGGALLGGGPMALPIRPYAL